MSKLSVAKSCSPDDPLFDTPGAAEYLGVSKPTLERWWTSGKGSAVIHMTARLVRYRKTDLDDFIRASTFAPGRRKGPLATGARGAGGRLPNAAV